MPDLQLPLGCEIVKLDADKSARPHSICPQIVAVNWTSRLCSMPCLSEFEAAHEARRWLPPEWSKRRHKRDPSPSTLHDPGVVAPDDTRLTLFV